MVLDSSGKNFETVRIALGAVGPTPIFAKAAGDMLAGQPVNDETIAKAAAAAREVVSPITDMRGTKDYRVHATGVLVRRVIDMAVARARGEDVDYKVAH